jgi:rhamnose transport system ATP-binding protein
LENVSLELGGGEVLALIGENGAGKSSLIKIITGAVAADAGTIHVRGQQIPENSPARAREMGIAAIYQQPALFAELSVAENIALRRESPRGLRVIRWSQRRENARRLLAEIGSDVSPDAVAGELSMPQQQLVEIAAALGVDARILILDEPTACLSEREVENLFGVLRGLRQRGVGIIYISHRMEELGKIADRAAVLRDGRLVAQRQMAQTTPGELIRLMVGRELSSVFPKTDVNRGEVVLRTDRLSCTATGVNQISLEVRSGEILGISGLAGAGRSELARVLFGLTPAESGQIYLRNRAVQISSPADAVGLGIAYVPEDRRRFGVILEMAVRENATLAILRRISRLGMIDFSAERHLSAQLTGRLGTKMPSLEAPIWQLSGGNQQKVALARWLATEPKVVILDEPTQGVDVGGKSEIHRLIGEMAARGMAIIMISSELPEILGMSDHIAVMRSGEIVATLDRAEATEEKLLQLALGHRAEVA